MATFLIGYVIGLIIGGGLLALTCRFFRTSDCDECTLARQADERVVQELRRKRFEVIA